MADVTPAQALAHPTWSMGRVITTNSATLVNKGLELLEAHLLYGVDLDRIDVVVHPQSIVHSMVQFVDGSTLAQCSPPDMRLPIALGAELAGAAARGRRGLRLVHRSELDLRAAGRRGVSRRSSWPAGPAGGAAAAPAVYNAANEECVDAFHDGRIGFLDIVDMVARGVGRACGHVERRGPRADVGSVLVADDELTLEGVLAADAWARGRAAELIATGRTSAQPQEHLWTS